MAENECTRQANVYIFEWFIVYEFFDEEREKKYFSNLRHKRETKSPIKKNLIRNRVQRNFHIIKNKMLTNIWGRKVKKYYGKEENLQMKNIFLIKIDLKLKIFFLRVIYTKEEKMKQK